ncbi:hypothetical protein L7F22_010916 [Adiantum nelumboides]|nr:hypothetical protein [Adiantum nelumboides]
MEARCFGGDHRPICTLCGIKTGTKLYLSNLDYGVSNADIKELFSKVDDLKRCGIHYDRSGQLKGTAEVVYARRQDVVIALKCYNNVLLDGKSMKIELIGTNLMPSLARGRALSTFGRGRQMVVMGGGVCRGCRHGHGSGEEVEVGVQEEQHLQQESSLQLNS